MKRLSLCLAACAVVFAPAVRAQAPDDLARSAAFVAPFQNPDGGFGAKAGDTSSLGATSSAIRVLKNTGGSIPDVLSCVTYVLSCRDAVSGGFAPTPGGTPNVRTTAVGLMAAAELKVADDKMSEGAIGFFSRNVKGFEDIRIAVAGLEAVRKASPEFTAWTARVESDRNPDGTWGKGPGRARDTGGAAVALLRMGVALDKKDVILAALREGQRPDGGWGKADGGSDLESTDRVMRAFFMLSGGRDLRSRRGLSDDRRLPPGARILAGRIRRRQGRPGGARRRPLDLQDGSRPRDPDGPVDAFLADLQSETPTAKEEKKDEEAAPRR